jgi:hypothetical protein
MIKKCLGVVLLLAVATFPTARLRAGGGFGDWAGGGFFGGPGDMNGGPGGSFGPGMGGVGGGAANIVTLQQALSSPDEEWAVLSPKVQRILELQQQLAAVGSLQNNTFGRGFGGGFGGPAGMMGGAVASSPIATSLTDLNNTLQDPTQSDNVLRVKLQVYRDAVKTAKSNLQTAREDLRTYVTLRQEALLMGLGYLD